MVIMRIILEIPTTKGALMDCRDTAKLQQAGTAGVGLEAHHHVVVTIVR